MKAGRFWSSRTAHGREDWLLQHQVWVDSCFMQRCLRSSTRCTGDINLSAVSSRTL